MLKPENSLQWYTEVLEWIDRWTEKEQRTAPPARDRRSRSRRRCQANCRWNVGQRRQSSTAGGMTTYEYKACIFCNTGSYRQRVKSKATKRIRPCVHLDYIPSWLQDIHCARVKTNSTSPVVPLCPPPSPQSSNLPLAPPLTSSRRHNSPRNFGVRRHQEGAFPLFRRDGFLSDVRRRLRRRDDRRWD